MSWLRWQVAAQTRNGAWYPSPRGPEGRTGRLRRSLLGLSVLIATTVIGAPAYGTPIFVKPNVPDFYQHQKAGDDANKDPLVDKAFDSPAPRGPAPRPADPPGVPSYDTGTNWWERGGGWCCVTAFVNSFYFLEKTYGFTGFFTRPEAEAAFAATHMGNLPTWQQEMIYATEDMARDLGFTNMIPCPTCGPEGPTTRQGSATRPSRSTCESSRPGAGS